MVVEHDFVTTLAPPDALWAADGLLRERGFEVGPGPAPDTIQFRRGRRAKVTTPADRLPQHGQIAYDRGRITLAASMQTRGKPKPLHQDVLVALATDLERLLADRVPLQQILAEYEPLFRRIKSAHRRVITLQVIAWCVVLSPLVILIVLVFVSALNRP